MAILPSTPADVPQSWTRLWIRRSQRHIRGRRAAKTQRRARRGAGAAAGRRARAARHAPAPGRPRTAPTPTSSMLSMSRTSRTWKNTRLRIWCKFWTGFQMFFDSFPLSYEIEIPKFITEFFLHSNHPYLHASSLICIIVKNPFLGIRTILLHFVLIGMCTLYPHMPYIYVCAIII